MGIAKGYWGKIGMAKGYNWLFLGQNTMGAAALTALLELGETPRVVLTRLSSNHHNDVETISATAGLTFHRVADINEHTWHDLLIHSDVAVCCGWSQRLSPETLALPTDGWLNLHPSALPEWRGSNPIGWQMLVEREGIGCTVHRMTSTIDKGPVLRSASIRLAKGLNAGQARTLCGTLLGQLASGCLNEEERHLSPLSIETLNSTSCPPKGAILAVEAQHLSRARLARVLLAFSPRPGVLLLDVDPGKLAVASSCAAAAGAHELIRVTCRDGACEVAMFERAS